MAGFQGFGYKAPEEIIAETQAGFQRALQSGDRNQMRAAIAQQAAFAIGGSPELARARKTRKVLENAYSEAPDTGDEVADQMAFYEKAQKAAIDAELPEIAMQATQQLSQLRLMQEERSRLRNAEGRAQAKEKRESEAFNLQIEVDKVSKRHLTQGLLVNPDTLEVLDRGDLTDPEALERMNQLKAENPNLVFRTEGEFIELTEAEKDRKARLSNLGNGMGGRSTLYKDWYKKTQATDAFATTAGDFVDLLMLDDVQQVFGAGGGAKGLVQRAGAHARSFIGDEGAARVEERFAEDARWNTLSSEKQALIMELGYALATSREGGRLTDQDVERAIKTLGVDNPDPRAVAWIFGRAMTRTRDVYENSLLTSGVEDLESVRRAHSDVLGSLNAEIERLESKYKIDFDDEDTFENITNPTASSAKLNPAGFAVREVKQSGRGASKVRDFTGGT